MKYKLLLATSAMDMERKVNNALQKGWKLHGSTSCAIAAKPEQSLFSQAMIKDFVPDYNNDNGFEDAVR